MDGDEKQASKTEESLDSGSEDFNFSDDGDVDSMFDFFSGKVTDGTDIEGASDLVHQKATWSWPPLPNTADDDYIRVLSIEPVDRRDEEGLMKCTLHVVSLQHPPAYQALSYAWGKEDRTEIILVNDEVFFITPTLKNALVRIAQHSNSQVIRSSEPLVWIDAICIDQANDLEKSSQVMLMDQIFRKSACVLIWLGEHPSHAAEIQSSFERLAEHGSHAQFYTCEWICSMPWFFRRWAVQEFRLQENHWLMINRLVFPFAVLEAAMNHVNSSLVPEAWLGRFNTLTPRNGNLLYNMIVHSLTKCSDPRDLIYSLRSISSDGTSFPVDYRKSFQKTYAEFAKSYACTEWLPLLMVCATVTRMSSYLQGAELSSWIPDWVNAKFGRSLSKELSANLHKFECESSGLDVEIINQSTGSSAALVLNAWIVNAYDHQASYDYGLHHNIFRLCSTWGDWSVYEYPNEVERDHTYCLLDGCSVVFGLKLIRDCFGHQNTYRLVGSYILKNPPRIEHIPSASEARAESTFVPDNAGQVKEQMKRARIRLV